MSKEHKIKTICKKLNIARSTYYDWKKKEIEINEKEIREEVISNEIKQIQTKNNYCYGYRKVNFELKKKGIKIGKNKTNKIMKNNQLLSIIKAKKKWHGRKSGEPCENKINREFIADNFSEKLVTDITEFRMKNRKIYLSAIMDLKNNEILAFKIKNNCTVDIVTETIEDLLAKTEAKGAIFHSDQGCQYTSNDVKEKLKEAGINQSMSRRGNCLDNACIESFWGVLKSELIYNKHVEIKNSEELERKILEWIEYYNTERIQAKLEYLSPLEYRKKQTEVA